MSDLTDLYQEVILDHNRNPRRFKELANPTRVVDGYNPLCGDKIKIFVRMEDDLVREITFTGAGCAISKASASLMMDAVQGMSRAEAERLFEVVHRMLTGGVLDPREMERLGNIVALSGVSAFPMRVKCATLAWHTLRAALAGENTPVTTE